MEPVNLAGVIHTFVNFKVCCPLKKALIVEIIKYKCCV